MDRYVNFAFEVPVDTCFGPVKRCCKKRLLLENLGDCASQHEAIFHGFRLCVKHF